MSIVNQTVPRALRRLGYADLQIDEETNGDLALRDIFRRAAAATDNSNVLVAVKESIAGRTGGNAATFICLFGWQAEIHRCRASGDDQGIGGVGSIIALQHERA